VAFTSTSTNLASVPIAGLALYMHERPDSQTAVFSASPASLSFGNVLVGITSAAKTVTVSNTGAVALPISSITLGGSNPAQFTRTHNCPAELAVGAKCTASVRFKPSSKGSKSATLKVAAGGGATAKIVALAGTGI
jgi:hypothetical protein